MHPRPRSPLLVLAAAVALAPASCSADPVDESGHGASEVDAPTYPSVEDPGAGVGEPAPGPSRADGNREILLTAIETALASVEGSKVYAVESESGGTVWEVEAVDPSGSRFEIDVSADGSRILSGPDEKSSEPKHLERVNGADVEIADILDAALEHIPGTIIELELDTESRLLVWEVEIVDDDGRSTDFNIDAATGEVIP